MMAGRRIALMKSTSGKVKKKIRKIQPVLKDVVLSGLFELTICFWKSQGNGPVSHTRGSASQAQCQKPEWPEGQPVGHED